MSDLEPVPDDVHLARGEADLALAARQLRDVAPVRAVEIGDRVLQRALAAPRRAALVRARPPHGFLRVSTVVITAVVREHLDARLDAAAVGRVLIEVDRAEELTALTIELIVQYGTPVLEVGDRARELAREAIDGLLGADDRDVVVVRSHVHVADVTVGDPHLVDPSDE